MLEAEEKIFRYFFPLVNDNTNDFSIHQLKIFVEDFSGFYISWETINKVTLYELMVPIQRSKLTWITKLTLRHEAGHIIFHELLNSRPADLRNELNRMKKTCFGIFRFLESFWYWNRALRKIKGIMGYSGKIEYKKDDHYSDSNFTREDNEFFCDHFALFGRRK